MENAQISFHNVSKSFRDLVVHRDISFEIGKSEIVTLIGPSGTGKTVVLKLIIGLLMPSGGDIRVFGKHINKLKEDELTEIRSDIGMLFQGAALFDSLSVFDNIAYGLREVGSYSEEEIADIVNRKLKIINLPNIGHKTPPELSGGQKKRVGLARALASSPKIVLFDEPTTGLDPTSVRMIDDLILRLKDEFDITSIIVTHDIESAKRISDRWILFNQGMVVADGRVEDLLNSNEHVINFVNGHWYEN